MMRQAGRYLPQYREIRQRYDFLTLCRTPELAAEVTLQPVELVGVDAAILFADILLPLDAMGAGLGFAVGEGPYFERPVRSLADAEMLKEPDVETELGYVFEALSLVRRQLAGQVPVIGFAGTPWTLAAYLVEGGASKSFGHLLQWSYRDPQGLGEVLARIGRVSLRYLEGQIDAGAQALQLFDTWGGLLDARRWREVALPPLLEILEGLAGRVPLIYYVNGGFHLLEETRRLPVEVLSVDWRVPLDRVRQMVGPGKTLQGNLDPGALLGPVQRIEELTVEMLAAGAGGGHVVNLGHGILPTTPPEHARAFVAAAQRGSGPRPPSPGEVKTTEAARASQVVDRER
jgi:uroporphyrinogen decarboxylase